MRMSRRSDWSPPLRDCGPLLWAAVIGLALTLCWAVGLFTRTGEVRLEQQLAEAASHEGMEPIELYKYRGGGGRGWLEGWEDFGQDSNLLVLQADNLASRQVEIPIDDVHAQGLLHRGTQLAVLRERLEPAVLGGPGAAAAAGGASGGGLEGVRQWEVLLLRRGKQLKTCPGAWSLLGEHSGVGEPGVATAVRALREELGVELHGGGEEELMDLSPAGPVLVRVDYPTMGRRDLQATQLFALVLPSDAPTLRPDAEVAALQWVLVEELLEAGERHGNQWLCNAELTDLIMFTAQLVKQAGY